ncbi:MAG: hypothetical protein ABIG84_06205 [archaeon]
MAPQDIAKKTLNILLCFLIALLIIPYSTLFFMHTLEKSVTSPVTYANVNILNCELSITDEAFLVQSLKKRCNFMNLSKESCSIEQMKNLANSIRENKTIENTAFLTDIVFLSYQNTINKDQCRLKIRGNDIYGGTDYYQYPYFRIPRINIIAPQKQSLAGIVSIYLENIYLRAMDAVLIHMTSDIRNNFDERCTLDQDTCDQKYSDLYSILKENIQNLIESKFAEHDLTSSEVSPIHEDEEKYLIFNNPLYASKENSNWTNPVSDMVYTTISGSGTLFILKMQEHFQKYDGASEAPGFNLSSTETIDDVAFTMAVSAVKAKFIAGFMRDIGNLSDTIVKKYRACMDDINCTKEVFQTHEYQQCTDLCLEEEYQYIAIEKENQDMICGYDCKTEGCLADCRKTDQIYEDAEVGYSSCFNGCYYGDRDE